MINQNTITDMVLNSEGIYVAGAESEYTAATRDNGIVEMFLNAGEWTERSAVRVKMRHGAENIKEALNLI